MGTYYNCSPSLVGLYQSHSFQLLDGSADGHPAHIIFITELIFRRKLASYFPSSCFNPVFFSFSNICTRKDCPLLPESPISLPLYKLIIQVNLYECKINISINIKSMNNKNDINNTYIRKYIHNRKKVKNFPLQIHFFSLVR